MTGQVSVIQRDELNHGEFILAQLAINDVPSVPFFVHKSVRATFPKEEEFMAYLERSAANLIEKYGDGRNPKSSEERT